MEAYYYLPSSVVVVVLVNGRPSSSLVGWLDKTLPEEAWAEKVVASVREAIRTEDKREEFFRQKGLPTTKEDYERALRKKRQDPKANP